MNTLLRRAGSTVAAVTLGALLLTGCSTAGQAAAPASAGFGDCSITGKTGGYELETKQEGVLSIGTVLPAPGAYNGDTPATVTSGYNYCMVAEIASRAGLTGLALQNLSFDALVSGVSDDFDLASLDIFITAQRQEVVDFSDPYLESATGVLVQAGSDWTEESLKKDGTVGVLTGSLQANTLIDGTIFAQPASQFQTIVDVMAALKAGQIDAVLLDTAIVLTEAANSNGELEVIARFDDGAPLGMVFPKGSTNVEVVNEILAEMKKDGSLDAIFSEWLWANNDPSKLEVWN